MRRLFLGTLAACQLAVGSQAAGTCASPQELKALQAAALEQQLAAAAQSCHLTADYGLFVAKYRGAIVRSDRAVKAFFQARSNSEGYDVFKTRIAQDTSLRSLHDPQFCRSAKAVFDMALGRDGAGKSPSMVQTGYEHCKMPVGPRTVVVTTTMPAARALALAETVPTPAPRLAPARVPVPRPVPTSAAGVQTSHASARVVEAPRREAPEIHPPVATVLERPRWQHADASAEGDHIPNAYKPGSVWVGAEVNDDPWPRSTRKRPPPMAMGPDGRWYVPIGQSSQQD